jgi:hypothetical protein
MATLRCVGGPAAGGSRTLYFYIPSITLTTRGDRSLQVRKFDATPTRAVLVTLTAKAMQIHARSRDQRFAGRACGTCCQLLKELIPIHTPTSGRSTTSQRSVMMISDLDRRGLHKETQQNLDAFLHYQGTVSMPGNFAGKEGQFYGAGGHETGGYNKSHGYVMWNMAEHWWMTRDRQWMERSAPGLVKSCDWVVNERKATMRLSLMARSAQLRLVAHGRWRSHGLLALARRTAPP